MKLSKGSQLFARLLLIVMCFAPIACTSTDDQTQQQEAFQADQQESDQQFVYVDENGNEVNPADVNSENYEIVDLAEGQSDETNVANSDYSIDDNTEQELKDILNSIEGNNVVDTNTTFDDSNEGFAVNEADTNVDFAANTMEDQTAQDGQYSENENGYVDLGSYDSEGAQESPDGYVSLDNSADTSMDDSSSYSPASNGSVGNVITSGERETALAQGFYTVRKGDTLSHIAYGIYNDASRYPDLALASGLSNPHLIYPGDRIELNGTASASTSDYEVIEEATTYNTTTEPEYISDSNTMEDVSTMADATVTDVDTITEMTETTQTIEDTYTNNSTSMNTDSISNANSTTLSSNNVESQEWDQLRQTLYAH